MTPPISPFRMANSVVVFVSERSWCLLDTTEPFEQTGLVNLRLSGGDVESNRSLADLRVVVWPNEVENTLLQIVGCDPLPDLVRLVTPFGSQRPSTRLGRSVAMPFYPHER